MGLKDWLFPKDYAPLTKDLFDAARLEREYWEAREARQKVEMAQQRETALSSVEKNCAKCAYGKEQEGTWGLVIQCRLNPMPLEVGLTYWCGQWKGKGDE